MLIRLLRSHLAPYRKPLLLIVVLQTVQTSAALTLPTINARIIDKGVLPGNIGYIYTWGAVMLVFALIQIVFAVAAVYFGGKVAMSFGRDLRKNLFHQVTDFSAREVGTFGAPSLITRITNDVQQVQMLVVMACTMAIAAPITMVVGVIMALRQDVGLSIILVIAMPVAGVVLGLLVSRMVPAFRLMQERIDQVNRVLREQITGIRVVRAFVREPQEARRFATANDDLTEVSLHAGRLMSSMFPTVNLLINASSVGVLWLGASRVNSGEIQVGTLIAYLTYLVQILMSVVMATFMISMIPRASVSADRIQEVLDTDPSVVPPVDPVRDVVTHGALEFRDVGFHYPGAEHPVLTGVSFATAPGQTTAIVGSTGAGKSTLVNLILRLFDSTEGTVLVGGVDVHDLDPDVLWSTIGLVPAAALSLLGHRRQQPAVRQARRHRGRDVGRARGRAGHRLRPRHARRAARADRAGRHQRVGRAAPAACRSPGRSSASPTSTCSTTRSRPSTSRPTPGCAPRSARTRRTPPSSSWRSGCRPSRPPTTSSCSRTASSSAGARTTS